MRAGLVVTGRIATLAGHPDEFGWVEAIAIEGDRVVAHGTRSTVEATIGGNPRRIDLSPDFVVLPGITDAHLHLVDAALAGERIDLASAASLEDGLRRIAAAVLDQADEDAWIEGQGWDPVRWGAWPTADDLERVAPGRCVALWSHDHHAIWASRRALAAAGVDAATTDPPGGVIRRAADGTPSGCLQEVAASLVARVVLAPTPERLEEAIVRAANALLRLGVVAVHDPGELTIDADLSRGFAACERLAGRARLPIRVHVSVRRESLPAAIAHGRRSGQRLGDDPGSAARPADAGRLHMGWLKLFADGTLGARTARLLAPYETDDRLDEPPAGPLGLWLTEPSDLAELVERAASAGIASQIHAIGDAAVRAALDTLAPTAGRTPLMPRVEHVQLVDRGDLPRFALAGVAASVQPVHIRSDAASAWRFWGDARVNAGGYPYGSLARGGAVVAFGTDAPVESIDPWPGIATAVVRRGPAWPAGRGELGKHEALSLPRALRSACQAPAVAAGEVDRGRLVAGQRADLVVVPSAALDDSVMPGGTLERARPVLVLLDGEVVVDAASAR